MKTTVKPSGYLINSYHKFSEENIIVAKAIFDEVQQRRWDKLGNILRTLDASEREKIHYAFFDLFGFDYELKVRNMIDNYKELKKYGLA